MADELDFSVVLADFTTDASRWREIGAVVRTSYTTATGVEAVPFMMTDGLSYAAGFTDQYNRLASQTVAYLLDGANSCDAIATNLDDTRITYESSDEYATWKLNNP